MSDRLNPQCAQIEPELEHSLVSRWISRCYVWFLTANSFHHTQQATLFNICNRTSGLLLYRPVVSTLKAMNAELVFT